MQHALGQRAAPVVTPGRAGALLAGLLLPRLAIVAPLFLADVGSDPRRPSPTRPPEFAQVGVGVGEGAQRREGEFARWSANSTLRCPSPGP